MMNLKKMAVLVAVIAALGTTSAVTFAGSSFDSMAEILAALTGKTVAEVTAEKAESSKTFGALANEAGKLDEFKAEALVLKKEMLAEKVAAGVITQEQADAMIAAIEARMASCDGTSDCSAGGSCGSAMSANCGMAQTNGQACGMTDSACAGGSCGATAGNCGAAAGNCSGACVTE